MDIKQLATDIITNVGGEKNVIFLTHCATRLRFTVRKNDNVNIKELESLDGVLGVVPNASQLQIIIGTKVNDVCEEIYKQTSISSEANTNGNDDKKEGNIFMRAIAVIPQIFAPIIPALTAVGC